MGVCNSPDIFQENISEIFDGFKMIHVCIDDVLVITKNKFEDHLKDLDRVLQRLTESGLKLNTEKSFFGRTETEHLGFWIRNNGVRPLSAKV